jgi:hypothetical protein
MVGLLVLDAFKLDLTAARAALDDVVAPSDRAGRPAGVLRALEVLIWRQVESRGY